MRICPINLSHFLTLSLCPTVSLSSILLHVPLSLSVSLLFSLFLVSSLALCLTRSGCRSLSIYFALFRSPSHSLSRARAFSRALSRCLARSLARLFSFTTHTYQMPACLRSKHYWKLSAGHPSLSRARSVSHTHLSLSISRALSLALFSALSRCIARSLAPLYHTHIPDACMCGGSNIFR